MTQLYETSATQIESGELEGDVTINEALWRFDWFTTRRIQQTIAEPLTSTTEGHAFIVGAASASSPWAGQDDNIAHYFNSTWHFYQPKRALTVIQVSTFVTQYYSGTGWGVYASAP